MNWKYKALWQLALSRIPFGERVRYFFQRYVTRNLPIADATFARRVSVAKKHIDAIQQYHGRPLGEASFYEYGAGWDMMVPLTFYAFGVEHQIVIDVRNMLRLKLVNDTIEKYRRIALDLAFLRKPDKYLDGGSPHCLALLKEYYGIDYRAPCDARRTGLRAGSIDCITSTDVLEHVPPHDIQAILRECYRLLRDGGVMSCRIDYTDHYSHFDKSISPYNFLQYSDKAWALFNPPLHYQNRLRHRDYLDLLRAAGFAVVEEQCREGTEADLQTLERLPLDPRFGAYSLSDLAIRNALILVRKRDRSSTVVR